jgi:effector-binding domain-containing protein
MKSPRTPKRASASKWLALLPLLFLLSCAKKEEPPFMETKNVPATQFLCVAEDVSQSEISEFAEKSIGPLFETLRQQGRKPTGNLQFLCPKWLGPDAKSTIVIGIPVAGEFPVASPQSLWKAPAYHCASLLYRGPMSGLKEAWEQFGRRIAEQGWKTTGSWREVYRYWIAPDSTEDITELQMEIE